MTFKQIEEEFDETFVNTLYSTQSDVQVNVWKLIDYGNGEHKIGHYYGPDEIKSFLKQSFIKYLQGQCEEIKKIQGDPFDDSDEYLHGIAYCKKELLNKLQAQIKELEV